MDAAPNRAFPGNTGAATGPKRFVDTFVAPRPSRALIRAMVPVNRIVMLKGIPLLRDIPGLCAIPGIRGLTGIRHIDLPAADEARLAASFGPDRATFIVPNHPEFFTDWMIDKEIVARVAPLAASWATHTVVNGLGKAMQRFWLANNLIAQVPGDSESARSHSIEWAVAGRGVLLHPEGAVGWHGDWIAPLMPGAAQMALAALGRGQAQTPPFRAILAPVVWKLEFVEDVDAALGRECSYVERRLGLASPRGETPADRIHSIYAALTTRDETTAGLRPDAVMPVRVRLQRLIDHWCVRIAELTGRASEETLSGTIRSARRWARTEAGRVPEAAAEILRATDTLQRLTRLGPFAWQSEAMTQEQAAEHLKRLRSDYCKGTMRDTLCRFVPQPAGLRRAIIRVPEPIDVARHGGDADALTETLRDRLQACLDAIGAERGQRAGCRTYTNPFHADAR